MKKIAIITTLCTCFFISTHAQNYPEMIKVEGGTYTMGDSEMEGDADEQPVHQVTLKSFSIANS
ncbi:MAG: SUMF1/EgtB/PvdO family nonheme iron enzyme [Bacteroidia bacterium]